MKIAQYEFVDGARFQKGAVLDPKAVGERLEELRQEFKGELTPEDVLKDAKGHNSPLHSFFEWDDSRAAQEHRLAQARRLIRSVVAVYVAPDKPARRMNAFVHIREPGAEHYRDTAAAMERVDTRKMVLGQAWRELQAWRIRYRDLKEFSALFEEMDKVAKQLPPPT